MDVLEKAKELSIAISEDERCKRLQAAKAINEADPELQKQIGAFNLKKIMLGQEYKKNPPDDEKLRQYEGELRDLYAEIMKNENMQELNEAKKELDELIGHINSIIQMAVSGEIDQGGCSGSCEGCSGCHS